VKGKSMLKFLFPSVLLVLLLSTITACNTNPNKLSFALDTDCKPVIIQSFNNLIEHSTFLRVTEAAQGKREIMKVNEQYFTRIDGEKWETLEEDPSNVFKAAVKGIESGDIKITNCKAEGTKILNGVKTDIISYSRKMELFPGAVINSEMKFYIGKDDGLPYMEIENSKIQNQSANTQTTFQYKNIIAPKI
jgi:hypothetical protein